MRSLTVFSVFSALLLAGVAPAAPLFAQDAEKQKPAKAEKPKKAPKEKKPKKGEAPAADAPKASPEFIKAIDPYNKASKANDWATAKAAVVAATAIAKSPYEKFIAGQYLTNVGVGAKNDADVEAGVEQMLASGFVPPEGNGQRYFFSGNFAFQRKDFAKAASRFTEALNAGYFDRNTLLLLVIAHTEQKNVGAAAAAARQFGPAFAAKNPDGARQVYLNIAEAYRRAGNASETVGWLRQVMQMGSSGAADWRKYVTIYLETASLERDATLDVRRLMDSAGGLFERRDFMLYAIDAAEEGLPSEALRVVNRGVAANKLSLAPNANNEPNRAKEIVDQSPRRISDEESTMAASERDAKASKTGRLARLVGDLFLSREDYAKAVSYYRLSLEKGGDTAPDAQNLVNTRLGTALFRLNDLDGAAAAFKNVTGARKDLAEFWLLLIDQRKKAPPAPAPAT